MTVLRVLPPELYGKVMSGKGEVAPGASVPGGTPGEMPGMHGGHEGHKMDGHDGHEGHKMDDKPDQKKDGKSGQHKHDH